MTYVDLKLPIDVARDYVKDQLNSYAYNTKENLIIYLNQLCYGDDGSINDVKIQAYPVSPILNEDITGLFTLSVPPLTEMLFIEIIPPTDKEELIEWIQQKNGILNALEEFKGTHTIIDINLPVFTSGDTSEPSTPPAKPFNPMDDITPADIEVDLMNGPINTGYIQELDDEIL